MALYFRGKPSSVKPSQSFWVAEYRFFNPRERRQGDLKKGDFFTLPNSTNGYSVVGRTRDVIHVVEIKLRKHHYWRDNNKRVVIYDASLG